MSKSRPLPPGAKRHSEQAKKVFSGVRFEVFQWQQKQFDDSVATFEVVKRCDSVVVLPVLNENEVVLVHEQQPHWEKPGTSIVAGMVHSDEDLDVAARRELEEETGMVFKNYDLVYVEPVVPGVEWFAYTFLASGYIGEKAKKLDAGERNEIVKMSVDELLSKVRNKELLYRPRFIEDFLLQDNAKGFREVLKNPAKFVIK